MKIQKPVRVAIVGDPHFNTLRESNKNAASHITINDAGDFLTNRPKQNPWEDLKHLIAAKAISADILICVGDIAFGADSTALRVAWYELCEMATAIGAQYLVSATGNHDVASRSSADKVGKNPVRELSSALGIFEPLKMLSPPYPVVEIQNGTIVERKGLRTQYFGDAFTMIETDSYRVIVLNSCCDHGSDAFQFERGSFPASTSRALSEALGQSIDTKINVLVCHHPPEPHSDHHLGGHDYIENGPELLRSLEQHGSWLVVHGHKHHGKITYAKGTGDSPIVFAASSLGMHLDTSIEGMRNQFYLVDFLLENGQLFGSVSAWDWFNGAGWAKSNPNPGGIFDGCGFGERSNLNVLASQIVAHVPCTWEAVRTSIPALRYLTPDALKLLEKRLLIQHKVVVEPNEFGHWMELARELA